MNQHGGTEGLRWGSIPSLLIKGPTFFTHSLGEGALVLEIDDPLLHNAGPAQREQEETESLRSEGPQETRVQERAQEGKTPSKRSGGKRETIMGKMASSDAKTSSNVQGES